MQTAFPMEVEGKYRVLEAGILMERLDSIGAKFQSEERHADTYLSHPCRDFRITDEALRIRKIDGIPWITYKGPRIEGALKMRPELELPLQDAGAEGWMRVFYALGFQEVRTVSKTRRNYQLTVDGRQVTVTIDRVDNVGCFVEIERVIQSEAELATAKADIEATAIQLGLEYVEKRSYLSMLIELDR